MTFGDGSTAAFRTGSIFEACDYLLQTGDAYSAEEKHRDSSVVRIVLACVPQLVFANFLRMLFLIQCDDFVREASDHGDS